MDTDEPCIIVSIDKDLLQLPGRHYNFVKDLFTNVSEEQGLRTFYLQLLTGDRSDNIPGLSGVGPKTAEKLLPEGLHELEMYDIVRAKYEEHFPQEWERILLRNGQLLKIRTREGELWQLPENESPSTAVV